MYRKLISIAVLVVTLPIVVVAQPLNLRSGHSAPVRDMALTESGEFLLSAGDDGRVIVWDAESERLVRSIHADSIPVRRVVPYPDSERVAIYSSDGQFHRIAVWNWREGTREFLHIPPDEVLHIEVSSQGSYLAYSMPNLRSVRLLDGTTGRVLPFLRSNTGIVTWFVISRSEERIMTYAPSTGRIVYRTIVTGREDASFEGPVDLTRLSLLSSPRFAAARTSDGLLSVVDLLSGESVADTPAGEIQDIQVDRTDGDIVVVSLDFGGDPTIRRFRFAEASDTSGDSAWEIQRRFSTRRIVPAGLTTYLHSGRSIFAGKADGELLRWLPFEPRPELMAIHRIDPVADILVGDDAVDLLGTDQILSLSSDFFDPRRDPEDATYVRDRVTRFDGDRSGRFVTDERSTSLIWTPLSRDEGIREFDPLRGIVGRSPIVPPDGLIGVSVYDGQAVFLNRSGLIEIDDLRTGAQTFSYRGRGLQTAILTPRGLFIGKAEDGLLDSSILRLDTRTGETVPLDTSTGLVFSLQYDALRGRLFSIGIQTRRDGRPATVIEVFEGAGFQRRRTILEIPGEYLAATLVVDLVTGNAYTTLDDRGGILRWDGTRISELFRNPLHIPKELVLNRNYLYSVNLDGTVSILNRYTGEPILDLYMISGTLPG
ncbi:MAG: WD40 repeat domain-containing protein, partial [Alkalispirochaeta sp.]